MQINLPEVTQRRSMLSKWLHGQVTMPGNSAIRAFNTMKHSWIAGIATAFVAGLLTLVLLQLTGWIHIAGQTAQEISQPTQEIGLGRDNNIHDARTGDSLVDATTISQLQSQLTEFRSELETARAELNSVRSQLETLLESQAGQRLDERFLPGAARESTAAEDLSERTGVIATNPGGNRRFGGTTSQEQYSGLIAAGVDQYVATEIKQQTDQWDLARLELIDTAVREGWRRTDVFGEKMRELSDRRVDIRAEIGDDTYDAYLFAAGENNRIKVQTIIDGSAAQLAGMIRGDIVLSYANSTVFKTRELQSATRDGTRGETVPVVVLRNGEYLELAVPRGPLGVSLSGVRQTPNN